MLKQAFEFNQTMSVPGERSHHQSIKEIKPTEAEDARLEALSSFELVHLFYLAKLSSFSELQSLIRKLVENTRLTKTDQLSELNQYLSILTESRLSYNIKDLNNYRVVLKKNFQALCHFENTVDYDLLRAPIVLILQLFEDIYDFQRKHTSPIV